nr:extracellular solute-binding protein [Clostridia bacterium]
MYTKRIISILMLVSLLTGGLASCSSDNGNNTPADTTVAAEVTTTAAETEPDYLEEVLPEKDYDGYEFRMYMRTGDEWQNEMYIEEADGDLMNDAIFERNSKVSELYNLKITKIDSPNVQGSGADKAILAGEDAYDMLVCHARTSFNYVQSELVVEWSELPYVDLDQPWWNQDARKEFTFNNKLYAMVGDISYLDFGSANGMLFNKKLLNDYKLDDPYSLVENDKWYFDKFASMAKAAISDLNGDSKIDYENDRLGYLTGRWIGPIQIVYSSGERICRMEDGFMKLTLNTPRTVNAFEKFFALATGEGMYIYESDSNPDITKPFAEGRVLFNDMNIKTTTLLRDMEEDFGIVPWPKLDESVDDFYANVDAGCSSFTVPKTVSDLERTSLVLEAMGYIGHTEVIPLYYETVLTTKYARDQRSVEMLEIINNARVFDIGYYYAAVGSMNSIGRHMVGDKNFNFASYYASLESQTLEKIKQINELYED